MKAASIPQGDTDKQTTEMGSLYFDPEEKRLVRLSDSENWDDYRVEVITIDDSETEMWAREEVVAFAARNDTEYLAGHCFDGHSPYGVWTNRTSGHPCPECGQFMESGFYHGGGNGVARKFYPGLTCPDNHGRSGHCPGHMTFEEANKRSIYLTGTEYLERRLD